MIHNKAPDALPTEIRFFRHQVIAEVPRDKNRRQHRQVQQTLDPGKEEMDRPVPNRGTDHKGDGNINEGIRPYVASLTPVKARMRYQNANTAHQQSENAQHDDPVSDTDYRVVTWPGPGPIERCPTYPKNIKETYLSLRVLPSYEFEVWHSAARFKRYGTPRYKALRFLITYAFSSVASQTVALQTETAVVGAFVTTQAVQDLPVNGRYFIKSVQLTPGANEGPQSSLSGRTRPTRWVTGSALK